MMQAVANFMAKVRGDRVVYDPSRIVMSGGATGAHELVTFCLADPGDAFLVPTPYYAGYVIVIMTLSFPSCFPALLFLAYIYIYILFIPVR